MGIRVSRGSLVRIRNYFTYNVMDDGLRNCVRVGGTCLPEDAVKLLQSLASSWGDVGGGLDHLDVISLKGAMTNKIYEIKWPTKTEKLPRKVLVRIYSEGVDVFFDRINEIRTFEYMSEHGIGPLLLGRFASGRIEEFIHARTLSAHDLRDPDISVHIAMKMKDFHNLDVTGPKTVHLWDRLRNWMNVAKSLYTFEESEGLRLDTLEEEILLLEKIYSVDIKSIGFCHNDLQYGNIMIDEDTRAITIIDYEYSSYNPVAFDIANHFCEWASDYHSDTPHVLDYNKYPCLEEQKRFLHAYMNHSGGDIELDVLIQEVSKYTLASHLHWGLWGVISERVNKIDFNFMEYAKQRFQQYWLRKAALFGDKKI